MQTELNCAPKFIVVLQDFVGDAGIAHPITQTAPGRQFSMWLEAAGLLGYDFRITSVIKRSISPTERISSEERANALDVLNVELQPFKCVICLGTIASTAVRKLEFTDKIVLALARPQDIEGQSSLPQNIKDIIESLQKFKSKLV
jgi:hypothetical protein